jgi:hypothetical protein
MDFIITEEKRKKELEKIAEFLNHLPPIIAEPFKLKVGSMGLYLTFEQFVYANNIYPTNIRKIDYRPVGYIEGETAFVWMPPPSSNEHHHGGKQSEIDFINRFIKIVSRLETQYKPKKWILDLRNNYGGLLLSFADAITPFVHDIELNIRSKNGRKIDLKMNKDYVFWDDPSNEIPLINNILRHECLEVSNKDNINVIVSATTGSAGEFVTYIMKKYLNATVYGYKTAGALSTVSNTHISGVLLSYPTGEVIDKAYIKHHSILPDKEGFNYPEILLKETITESKSSDD